MKKLLLLLTTYSLTLTTTYAQSWLPVGTGTNGAVVALDTFKGNLYAGGYFTTAGGTTVNHIAEWNGTSWSALSIGTNDSVMAITVYDGQLIVGGSFTSAGGGASSHIAVWNESGNYWNPLGTGLNGDVYTLIVYSGNLYAGGAFTSAGGTSVNYIAKWNGTTWSALSSGMDNTVRTLDTLNSYLYAGGDFVNAGGYTMEYVARWTGVSWSSLTTGVNNSVTSIVNYNNYLYILGRFSTAGGIPSDNIAAWNGTNWTAVTTGPNPGIHASTVYDTDMYIGSITISKESKKVGWTDSVTKVNDTIEVLQACNGYLYAGGYFDTAGKERVSYIAKFCDTCKPTPLAIDELITNKNGVSVYPNPSTGMLTFQIKNYELGITDRIEVYNMLGEKVYSMGNVQWTIVNPQFSIDLKGQPAGIYLYRVTNEQGSSVATGKLIVE